MRDVVLVNLDSYRSFQYEGLVAEYQRLIWAGLATHIYLDAARVKWGLDHDGAQLALYEAQEAA